MGADLKLQEISEQPRFLMLDCIGDQTALRALYSDLVVRCLERDVRSVLIRAGGRDDAGYVELRNALARLVLDGGSLGFRMALVGDSAFMKPGFRTLLTDLHYTGISVRWFESEKEALAWLER